jgi:hypothetical protein
LRALTLFGSDKSGQSKCITTKMYHLILGHLASYYSDMRIKPVFDFFSRKYSFSIFSYLKA